MHAMQLFHHLNQITNSKVFNDTYSTTSAQQTQQTINELGTPEETLQEGLGAKPPAAGR